LFARQDLSVGSTFVSVGTAVVLMALWAAAWALPSGPAAAAPRDAAPARSSRRGVIRSPELWFLGTLAMCALVGEGTAADWSAVYLHEDLGSSPGFAAVAFAAFSVAMTGGRLFGDRLTARFGPVALVRACGVLASVGMTAALLVDRPWAGVLGFACLGAGMSCIAPQVYSAAGQRDPARAGAALSLVVSLGYVGFLIGPIAIGSVSTFVGLPLALGIPALLVFLVALGAPALRPAEQGPAPTGSAERPGLVSGGG
jgi:fucose permease